MYHTDCLTNMDILSKIPFSYGWIVRKISEDNFKTVLDLGCDRGDFMKVISKNRSWSITGIELYDDSIKAAKRSGVYNKVVKGDVTKLPSEVITRKFDLVFSSQVLEHLNKKAGEEALEKWEALTNKRIVISTPVGFIPYEKIESREKEKNPLQTHLSGWDIKELVIRGYRVRGQGAAFIYGKNGIARKFPQFLPLFSILSIIIAPFVYLFPEFATYMIAWKDK